MTNLNKALVVYTEKRKKSFADLAVWIQNNYNIFKNAKILKCILNYELELSKLIINN